MFVYSHTSEKLAPSATQENIEEAVTRQYGANENNDVMAL